MKTKNIPIDKFLAQFNKEYHFLYQNRDNVAGYHEAVAFFDEFLENYKDFVCEFVQYRGDVISSDREAAAFSFALSTFEED